MTLASFTMGERTGLVFFRGLGLVLLIVLGVAVALLAARTLKAAARGEFCVPE